MAIEVQEHGRERLERDRVDERPSVDRPQSEVADQRAHRVPGGRIIAAHQDIAVDRVVRIAQMM